MPTIFFLQRGHSLPCFSPLGEDASKLEVEDAGELAEEFGLDCDSRDEGDGEGEFAAEFEVDRGVFELELLEIEYAGEGELAAELACECAGELAVEFELPTLGELWTGGVGLPVSCCSRQCSTWSLFSLSVPVNCWWQIGHETVVVVVVVVGGEGGAGTI